jgi:hypothetical protein
MTRQSTSHRFNIYNEIKQEKLFIALWIVVSILNIPFIAPFILKSDVITFLISFFLFCIISIFIHEFGHYVFAKKEGIYKEFKLNYFVKPTVYCKRPPKNKFIYLTGLGFSLVSYPFFLFLLGSFPVWFFLEILILPAIGDIKNFIVVSTKK